jgi:hypothetical protein
MIPPTGAVIAYSSFEKSRIIELASVFPNLEARLRAIANRVVDLLPVTRANWYHRDQRGSWSIKAVLPTVAAELDYAGLEVKDGGSAQKAYREAIAAGTSEPRRQAIDAALRAYCGRDTKAMIVLASALLGMGGGAPLTNNGQLVAGVGVSGGTVEQDVAILEGALRETFTPTHLLGTEFPGHRVELGWRPPARIRLLLRDGNDGPMYHQVSLRRC